jgi:hypothetical protein
MLTLDFLPKSYDSDIHSPNDMVIDSQDDHVVQPAEAENEKEAVIDITPDSLDTDVVEKENVILATDCTYSL